MGILVFAVLAGSISAVIALIAGYGFVTVFAVYCLAGLASVLLIILPSMWMCVLRKSWARGVHEKLSSEA